MFLQTPRQEIAGNYLQLLHFGGLLCFQEEDWFAYIDTEDRNTLLSCQGVCVCVCVCTQDSSAALQRVNTTHSVQSVHHLNVMLPWRQLLCDLEVSVADMYGF